MECRSNGWRSNVFIDNVKINTLRIIAFKEEIMKYGARNRIRAKVSSIKKGDVMSMVKFSVTDPHEMASVLTSESVEHLDIKPGDEIELIIKAIHVLPVRE